MKFTPPLWLACTLMLGTLTSNTTFCAEASGAGNGGDSYEVEFTTYGYWIAELLQSADTGALFPEVSTSRFRDAVRETTVITVEKVRIGKTEKDARNFPAKGRIEISRSRWAKLRSDRILAAKIVFHEYLGILGLESTGHYPISARLKDYLDGRIESRSSSASSDESDPIYEGALAYVDRESATPECRAFYSSAGLPFNDDLSLLIACTAYRRCATRAPHSFSIQDPCLSREMRAINGKIQKYTLEKKFELLEILFKFAKADLWVQANESDPGLSGLLVLHLLNPQAPDRPLQNVVRLGCDNLSEISALRAGTPTKDAERIVQSRVRFDGSVKAVVFGSSSAALASLERVCTRSAAHTYRHVVWVQDTRDLSEAFLAKLGNRGGSKAVCFYHPEGTLSKCLSRAPDYLDAEEAFIDAMTAGKQASYFINLQGGLVWVSLPQPRGSEPAGRRPALVLQSDSFNRSRIDTVIIAAITSNLRFETMPGNVRLLKGEGGIPKASVVNISQLHAIDRAYIKSKIGELNREKLAQVKTGLRILLDLDEA